MGNAQLFHGKIKIEIIVDALKNSLTEFCKT